MANKSCEKCGSLPFTQQEASVTCTKCGDKSTICIKCKVKGCSKCEGKLKSQMDFAAENNIMF